MNSTVTKEENLEQKNQTKTKPRNIHDQHRARMKTTYNKFGYDAFSIIEKLEFLLFFGIPFKDTNPTAHALLDEFGSIKNIIDAPYSALMKVKGMGEHSAMLIKVVHDLIQEYFKFDTARIKLEGTELAQKFCQSLYVAKVKEEILLIFITADGVVKGTKFLPAGTSSESQINYSELSKAAFEHNCNRVIIAHNHPFGKAIPSDEDFSFTNQAVLGLAINDVDVIDHIIVSPTETYSMSEDGMLEDIKRNLLKSQPVYGLFKQKYKMKNPKQSSYIVD